MKQSSSDNSNSKDFAQKRTEAELEALAIFKKRNADRRGDAEVEAQSLLNERKNYQQKKDKKKQAQNDIKAKAEARKAKAESRKKEAEAAKAKALAAKAKAEEEIRKVEAALEEKQINVGNFFSHNKKYIIPGLICLIILLLYLPFGFLTTILGIIFYLILFYYIYKLLSRFFPSCSGCFAIYLVGSAILCIFLFVRSCKNERESEQYSTEMNTVVELDDKDEIVSEDNSSVEEMLEKRFDHVREYTHYFEVRKNGMYGIADLKGNVMIAPEYDYITYSMYERLGFVEVKKDGKYGLVSLKTFTEFIKPKYDHIGFFSEKSKTIEVSINNKYGLVSLEDGTEIVPPIYDYYFSSGLNYEKTGLCMVCKNNLYGLYSPKKGKEVAPCIYDFISYDGGLYRVSKDGKSGYLNDDGSVLKPLQ